MAALIRGCLHINPTDLNEDEFIEAWSQTEYYLKTIMQTNFK